jgi:hypothetical protein
MGKIVKRGKRKREKNVKKKGERESEKGNLS